MVIDGNRFITRARIFFRELQRNSFPNASSLAKLCKCSNNTAQRVIYRLRDEYLIPLDYDPSEKGYYLKDKDYVFPTTLPPGKDELTALLLARKLAGMLEDENLSKCLSSLWDQYSASNPSISRDLDPLEKVFSSDLSSVSEIVDAGVLQYVSDAGAGQDVKIEYESPWSSRGPKTFSGRIEKVHYGDGALYLLLLEKKGRYLTLNAAFVKSYEHLDEPVKIPEQIDVRGKENWLDGFGIWAGEDLYDVQIQIAAPASKYYATERWHESQEDILDDDKLTRSFRSALSPELIRRILSLGKFVIDIKPQELKERVREEYLAAMKKIS